jgi:MFS family permease
VEERVRYRAVLANQEFRAVYLAQVLSLLGDELARIALAVLVYRRTGSPLATSATWAVSYLAYLAGGPLLAGLSDRYPRLTVMVISDLLRAPLVLLLCLESLPIPSVFVLIAALGALAPPFDSARSSLQPDLLDGEAYIRGNALMNLTIQVSQIAGFVLGGTLVAVTSVRGALGVDAATFLISAGLLLHGVRHRAAAQTETRGVFGDLRVAFRLVTQTLELRRLLQLSLLSSLAVVGTEGLAVLVAHDLGGGPKLTGILTATAPAGFLIGSVIVLRLDAERRLAVMPRLVVLSCVPLLLTPFTTSTAAIVALWVLAGVGVSVNLIAGPAFMQRCPREIRARAYGVASTTLWAVQGLGLLAAGALANVVTPRQAVALVAGGTLVLALPVLAPKGIARTVRGLP